MYGRPYISFPPRDPRTDVRPASKKNASARRVPGVGHWTACQPHPRPTCGSASVTDDDDDDLDQCCPARQVGGCNLITFFVLLVGSNGTYQNLSLLLL
jgi:hypothetical protein